MNDSGSSRFAFSAALAVLLLLGGAIGMFFFLKEDPTQVGPGASGVDPTALEEPVERPDAVEGATDASGDAPKEAADEAPNVTAVTPPPSGPVSIRGTVRDPDGTGIPGARLAALHLEEWNGIIEAQQAELSTSGDPISALQRLRGILARSVENVPRTESGPDGSYTFHDLAAGEYRLFTTHSEYLPEDQSWCLVEAGNPATVDIELLPGAFIAGRIVDGSAQPVAGAVVTAVPVYRASSRGIGKMFQAFASVSDGRMVVESPTFTSAADGSFRVGPLEPVAHDLTVKGHGFVEARAFKVPPGTEDVVIVVDSGLTITGILLGPDAEPITGADWTLKPELKADVSRNPLALAQTDFDILGENTRRGTTGEGGELEITGLEAGSYVLTFETAEHPRLKLSVEAQEPVIDLGEILLDEPLSISGVVIDSRGAPVADARVRITTESESPFTRGSTETLVETFTAERGEFTLARLARGAYVVEASAPGYALGAKSDVEAGTRSITITLEDGATLKGFVRDARDRTPIAGARLVVIGARRTFGETNDEGYFEISGIGASNARSRLAEVRESARQVQITHPEYAPKYERLAGQTDGEAPLPEVLMTPVIEIAGTVVNEEGEPVKNARVRVAMPGIPESLLMFSPGGSAGRVFSAADGSFALGLPSRVGPRGMAMEVVAMHPSYASGRVALGQIVEGARPPSEVQIVLTRGSTIEGQVTDTSGRPVGGAQIRVKRPVELQGEALLMQSFMPQSTGTVVYSRPDGTYRLRSVEDGAYQMEVAASGYAKKVVENVVVSGGTVQQDIVIDPGGTIEGRVVDMAGEPLAGAEVVAFLDLGQFGDDTSDRMALEMLRFTGRGTSMTRTDADGRYALRQLPEGEYTVLARALRFLPEEHPDLSPGDRAPDLVLRRFSTLRLTVLDGITRRRVPEFRVQLRMRTGDGERDPFGYQPVETVGDGSGQFTRENLRPGVYQVGVLARGFMPYFKEVRIGESAETELSAVLTPGLSITAVVTEAEGGEPIAGATLRAIPRQRNENRDRVRQLGLAEEHATDENGVVTLDSLEEGKYLASISHPGYFPSDDNELDFELPADDGRALDVRMHPAGQLRGKLTNLGVTDARSVSFQLKLTRQEDMRPEAPRPGAREEGPPEARPSRPTVAWVGVNLYNGGTFEGQSLRPGRYEVELQKRVYIIEENRRRSSGNEPPVPLGSVVIKPGETATVNFSVP